MTTRWRHEEIADLLGRLVIKASGGFLEAPVTWRCPACQRSKTQIVAPGRNVDIVARIVRHHDHIENLISEILLSGHLMTADQRAWRHDLEASLCRQFCRFQAIDICEACNTVESAAKQIVQAPRWFSFSQRGIANIICRPAKSYAVKHEIDRRRLNEVWDQVSLEIEGLEGRIRREIDRAMQEAKHA